MNILGWLFIVFTLFAIACGIWLQFKQVPPDCPICEAELAALTNDVWMVALDEGWVGASLLFCPHRDMKRA